MQSGENSQLFMENSLISQGKPSNYQSSAQERPKVSLNLMDVVFEEQNLASILEVSPDSNYNEYNSSLVASNCSKRITILRRLVGRD